ncbi:DUF4232 domain-containing protein [Actinopolyspora xinjiangensis]|nr:DUF4232 domain-containing protein [Actinopolyspora xinjiangensis]
MRARGIVALLPLVTVVAMTGCGARPAHPGEGTSSPATTTVRPTPTTASAAADCPETGVRLTTDSVDVAMGLRVMRVELANCGDRPYALDGYPRVRVLDEDREPLDVRAERGSADIATVDGFDDPPEAITLRPGEHAETLLMWRNTNASMNAPVVGEYLRIAPARGRPWQPVVPVGRERGSSRQDRDAITMNLGSTAKLGVRAWYR